MTDRPSEFRTGVYALLLTVTVASATARVLHVERVYEPSMHRAGPTEAFPPRDWPPKRPLPGPTLGGNDRSRWATVHALVDNGTFAIGRRVEMPDGTYRDEGIVNEDGFQTLDLVLNPYDHQFYSSKPPLLPTMLAGEYWLLKQLFGWSIVGQRWEVVRVVLLTVNVLPLGLFLCVLAGLLERYGRTDWGRLYVFAAACFGTFLPTFAVTLNNHGPAACTTLFALAPLLRPSGRAGGVNPLMARPINDRLQPSGCLHPPLALMVSGFFAGLTACLELPAAALLVGLAGLLGLARPRALLWFGPAATVPVAALLLTNYLAIGEVVPVYEKFGTAWYEFPGSYWDRVRKGLVTGIDAAKEAKPTYAFHLLIGHHGLFSLTPIWVLALVGMVVGIGNSEFGIRNKNQNPPPAASPPEASSVPNSQFRIPKSFVGLSAALTLVVIAFYIARTDNYGGWTGGPRWFFWLTPIWLLMVLPAADRLDRSRGGRGLGYLLLAVSAFSAAWPVWNPWRHPWLYQLCEACGWIRY